MVKERKRRQTDSKIGTSHQCRCNPVDLVHLMEISESSTRRERRERGERERDGERKRVSVFHINVHVSLLILVELMERNKKGDSRHQCTMSAIDFLTSM